MQAGHVAKLGVVYAVAPEARSCATTVYMTTVFLGGAGGSLAAATMYGVLGWAGAVSVSVLLAASALVAWAAQLPVPSPRLLDEAYPEATA